ncbi:MAG: carbohydrate kinase [Gammaproteobacteria bacterium]|nr:MAG: carbohydrate kinase [Gammaproteobacteria bacterium]
MTLPCFVGIDLGTSGCRALAIDEAGKELAGASVALPAGRRSPEGGSEQDPGDWWEAILSVLRKLSAGLHRHLPAAIAVDGTSASLLLMDSTGNPVTPALMYDDQRAREQARLLRTLVPSEVAVQGPTSSLAKLLWLKAQGAIRPHLRVLHQAEWITARLSGRFDLGDENNCLKLGYDPVRRAWPDWLEELALPAGLLHRVVPAGTPLEPLQKDAAGETGLPRGCLVVAGTTDSTAAALAAGLTQPGDALTSLGSTLVTKVLLERPLAASQYGIYSHRIFDHWLAGGASNSGGRVLRQFFSDREIARLSERIVPGRRLCLDYYPLPAPGERFPFNDPDLEPRMRPVPRDRVRFLQGLLEGIANIEKLAYRRLEALGAPWPRQVLSSGGGAKNPAWQGIRQRVLGTPVHRARHAEAAYGAALIARRGYRRQT